MLRTSLLAAALFVLLLIAWKWSVIGLVVVLAIAVIVAVFMVVEKVKESENQRVMLVREFLKTRKRGMCPLLKVKA